MSDVINAAIEALNEKLGGNFDGLAKFNIGDEGSVIIDADGARFGDAADDADVVLTSDVEAFQAILSGELNPTTAFMTGKLSVEGDMAIAMNLASLIS